MRNDWLKDRLKEIGKTGKGLADALGVAPARITEMVNGGRDISAREIPTMASYLQLAEATLLAWVTGGALAPAALRPIQVIGAVQAGAWVEAVEWDESERYPSPVAAEARFSHLPQFGLEVRGPSMNELYPPGSIITCVKLIDLGRDPRPGEKVICQRRTDLGFEATVKELRLDESGVYWLWPRSSDPNFQQPLRLPPPNEADENEDVRLVALVVGSYRPEA